MMLAELWGFLKRPDYRTGKISGNRQKAICAIQLLGFALVISITLGMFTGGFLAFLGLELGEHAVERLLTNYSAAFVLFAAVIMAPIIEESIFRWPMIFFRKSPRFYIIFYVFTLSFGFYHLINFEIAATIIFLSPLLVSPQIIVGAFLGFIRIRLGLIWAIMFHSAYNLILVGAVLLLKTTDISWQ